MKRCIRLSTLLLASAAVLFGAGHAQAATQGTGGATSSGTVNLSLNLGGAPVVRISHLTDVALQATRADTDERTGGVYRDQSICVYSNTATKGYNVTAIGLNYGRAFGISDGQNGFVEVHIAMSDTGPEFSHAPWFDPGTTRHGLHSTATTPDCAGGDTAALTVFVAPSELARAVPGVVYTGVVTLAVGPE